MRWTWLLVLVMAGVGWGCERSPTIAAAPATTPIALTSFVVEKKLAEITPGRDRKSIITHQERKQLEDALLAALGSKSIQSPEVTIATMSAYKDGIVITGASLDRGLHIISVKAYLRESETAKAGAIDKGAVVSVSGTLETVGVMATNTQDDLSVIFVTLRDAVFE